jgi:energy-coupling factor transport system permease protein
MLAVLGWGIIMKNNKIKSFSSLHPATLMVYFISMIVIAMFSVNPVILTISLFGGLLFFASMNGIRAFLSDLGFYISMFLLITIINPLFSHNGVTPLFFMNGNPVTLEAILYGADIALMLVGVIYWCKCYSIIMTTDKFLFLFGKAVPKLSLVFSMALRFLPLFHQKLKEIRSVQKSIGLYQEKGFVNKITGELKIFSSLISWSLENSVDTANSMKARGYGLKGRTHFSMYRFKAVDCYFLIATLVLFAVTLLGMITVVTDFTFYPAITHLTLDISQIIVYSAFFVLSLLPFFTELKEELVWKYSVSKI